MLRLLNYDNRLTREYSVLRLLNHQWTVLQEKGVVVTELIQQSVIQKNSVLRLLNRQQTHRKKILWLLNQDDRLSHRRKMFMVTEVQCDDY